MGQLLFGEALEHRIVVGCFFRDILDDIPVLRDFAVFDAEDIDSSLTAIAGFQRDVIVDKHEIAVSADMFDFRPAFREFFEESLDAGLKRLTAVGEAGAVLDVFRGRQAVDHGSIVLVENLIPEIFHHLPVIPKRRQFVCRQCGRY